MAFSDLNTDVVLTILEYIASTSPATIRSLSLVNKALNRATRTLKHHKKVFSFALINSSEEVTRNTGLVSSWLHNEDVLRGLKCLTVRNQPDTAYPQATLAETDGLVKLLSSIGRLKHFHWNARVAIHLDVLEALHKYHPQAELTLGCWIRPEGGSGSENRAELELSNSECLTYLRAHGQHSYWSDDTVSGALNRIVASAPKLQTVFLRNNCGRCCDACCKGTYDGPSSQAIEKKAGFYQGLGQSTSIRHLMAFGDLDDFLTTYSSLIDLSQLHILWFCSARTHTPDFFLRAPDLMPGLRHLNLQMHTRKNLLDQGIQEDIDEALATYLTKTCPPLEVLELTVQPNTVWLAALISHHGPTLREFSLHCRERWRGPPRQSLYLNDVAVLKASAPNLTHLFFDMQRRSLSLTEDLEYYTPLLTAVATLNLQKLNLGMDVGIALTGHPDIKDVSPLQSEMPPLRFLPPANTHVWNDWEDPWGIEDESTDVEAFVRAVWCSVFGDNERIGGASKKLELRFEEWHLWWRIRRGNRINVKEHSCMRSLWSAESGEDREVSVRHVSSTAGSGVEGRVSDSLEFHV